MALYSSSSSKAVGSSARSEFEVLKAAHKFLREDDEERGLSWDDQVAKKYYENLYREFAVCDLKHYKSGNFSLRWRTESEVISGAGETTCGNTRCPLHSERAVEKANPSFNTLELPFSYSEAGENKFALVKVVLCPKCTKKLMWKRNKEKQEQERKRLRLEQVEAGPARPSDAGFEATQFRAAGEGTKPKGSEPTGDGSRERDARKRHHRRRDDEDDIPKRRRSSRSRSPARISRS